MKHNNTARSLFVAEWQDALGGSDLARYDALTLMRYSTTHARATLADDVDILRKVERSIRYLVHKWNVTPVFRTGITDTTNTVAMVMPDGRTVEIPQQVRSGKQE